MFIAKLSNNTGETMETLSKIPNHIGFIIDGNGRWAKKRGLPRSMGHAAGIKTLDLILKECFYTYNIKFVSIYAFSTENWNRPKAEINFLEQAFIKYLKTKEFVRRFPSVKLNVMGDYTVFSKELVEITNQTLNKTKDNTQFVLNLCVNYSGQDEIVRAVNNIIADKKEKIDRKQFEDYLYTNGQPPLDFVVRTSGEQRISNFMLWQMSYAELYFPKVCWPSFKRKQLFIALKEYQGRDRRFGAIDKDADK